MSAPVPLILRGDARNLPIADASVDLIVTSPPYFGQRSYQDGGEHYKGQIGDESSPYDFLDALLEATTEMVRVLKPSGSIWVNLGDKYCSPGGHTDNGASTRLQGRPNLRKQGRPDRSTTGHGVKPKSLFGLPWRYALGCIDDLGLILRRDQIWHKPNAMPESATDRCRTSHEYLFHFTKEPQYFAAVDEIREQTNDDHHRNVAPKGTHAPGQPPVLMDRSARNPLGKLPSSVWEIPTAPLSVPDWLDVEHFASYPLELPRRIIRGWSPSGICSACGEGRRPIVATNGVKTPEKWHDVLSGGQRMRVTTGGGATGVSLGIPASAQQRSITGYDCACDAPTAPTRPALVLDPFGGTGTTALAARALGRDAIHVDLSRDYCRLAQWRISDPGELARALQVEKPPAAPDGMDSLLDLLTDGAA